ncbi:uncharacterized protein [Paramormyrops kingsleyae]|uniref:uncharacterized protein n=1 Tax=Paramormyrops kingsleyae TaxID=1676925 RepID=UPI003B975B31
MMGGDVVYSQVKFPDPLPFHSASQDGQSVPQGEDVIYSQVTFQPSHPPGLQAETEWTTKNSYSRYRLFSLGLGLLFLLLFIIIIFLSVHVHRGNQTWSIMEDNLKQLRTNYSILAKENDQIQNKCSILAKEKDRLQEDNSFLSKEKEQLQDNCNNDKDQLEKKYKMLANDQDQLEKKYNILTNSNNLLQNRYDTLIYNKSQIQNEYNILSFKMNQLQGKYNKLRDELQENNSTLGDCSQQKFNILLNKLPFLKEYCKPGKACTPCPKGWNIFNDKCYYQFRIKKNWEESKTYCSEHGGNLAVIESQEEQEFIKTFIKDGNSWIGLTDREREGSWLWVNGAELKESFWAIGEPNDRTEPWIPRRTADCVYFQAKDGVWFDDDCDKQLNSLCESQALSLFIT